MICPFCKEEGKKSTLREGMAFTTAAGFEQYYDEEGKHHCHNTNSTTTTFNCSNGHAFRVISKSGCNSCNFNEGGGEVVEKIDNSFNLPTNGNLVLN